MKRTTYLVLAMMLAALALGACAPSTIVANAAPPQRLLNVTGTGTVYLQPDVAYINIGVHTELPTAAEAVADNNAQTQQVIEALKSFGLKEADIRTAYFSIYPSVQFDPQTSERRGTTYVVDNSVYVTVREIDKLGDLLDATLSAGANSVNSIQFDVEDKSEATKEARDAAVADAAQQAKELAGAAGITLGELQRIDFYSSLPPQVFAAYGKGGGGGAEAASVPIQTGQLSITATVSVSYELK
jgi:uncharacterized protein YggE